MRVWAPEWKKRIKKGGGSPRRFEGFDQQILAIALASELFGREGVRGGVVKIEKERIRGEGGEVWKVRGASKVCIKYTSGRVGRG